MNKILRGVVSVTSAFALLASGCVLTACGHEHTYRQAWSTNQKYHWHEATCGHSDEVKDKAEHVWKEVEKTKDGVIVYECECGVIRKHTHDFATEWSKDDTYHWHAAVCDHPDEVSGKGEHNWTAGETVGDTVTYTCGDCGATKTHTHTYSEDWAYDNTNHWHASTCEHRDKVLGLSAHVFDEGVVSEDKIVYTCACGYSYSEELAQAVEYIFEAEHTDLKGVQGAGYSGGSEGVGLIGKDYFGISQVSGDCYIAGLNLNGTGLTFKINSDRAVKDAELVIRLSAEFMDITFTDDEWLVQVNGKKVSYGSVSIYDVITDVSSEYKRPFEDLIKVKIDLKEGENIITLTTNNSKAMVGTMYATAPMVDCIKITTTAKLTMTKYNEDFLARL